MTAREAAEQAVKNAVALVMEHYDACQIIASRQTPERCTECFTSGAGNWYARKGMVQYQAAKNDEDPREEVRIEKKAEEE
jgi:hypothetical protein